ncbi:acyl transferase/acyl hydrolase/lysophospholipase [Parachaetomium inaequale]|uniref:Acyl transferase/acyl hydrolase/lysophospholipase n=1 Tax=Parachaetomium inaequale TaxID=2588326 RepID=A0AAN6P4N1_9PEZI|nr:acyl transferase/acyl hydrolase/lysophospholipase [Parachaetomium inaequale]
MLQVQIHNHLDYTPEPSQCFDLICGTSTGGLVAVLLGRLGKSLAECEQLFRDFGATIFAGVSLWRASRMVAVGSRHSAKGLADVIRLQAGAGQEDMFEPAADASARNHVAVVAVSKTGRYEHLFRTYGVRASQRSCSIVDACLATSAATTFFPSITINGVEYVDGAFKYNNPSSVVLSELESAEWLAPMQDAVTGVGCLVSVGTGRPTFKRESSTLSRLMPNGALSLKDAATLCKDIVMDCHGMHLEVQNRFNRAGAMEAYYRFDVDMGLESVGLNENDEDALQHISAVTEAYMKRHGDEIKRCAQMISPRTKSAAIDDIIKELSGIPLALEQAGALIRHGEFTFASFLDKYRKEYRRLMSDHSDSRRTSPDRKSRAIITVLDMAYRSLENSDHAALLIFIGVLGSWQIPISFLERFQFFDLIPDELSSMPDDLESLNIVHEPSYLRLALHRLARSCLIRLKVEGVHIVSFTIHRVLCQWSLDNVTAHSKQAYIMQAAYGLSQEIFKDGSEPFMLDEESAPDAGDPVLERKLLAPFLRVLSIIAGHVSRMDLDPHTGRFRALYATVLRRAAWAYLAQGLAEDAKDCFRFSIGFETVRVSKAGLEWPDGETALGLLCGFSRACQKSGDLSQAVEALELALPLAERLHGDDSDITLTIVSRLKAASERREVMQQHHKAVVVASTTSDSNVPKNVQE